MSDTIYDAPSNLKSKVWKKFGFHMRNGALDKNIAICKLCKTAVKYTGSTTNLNTHLVRRHGDTGDEASTASTKTRQDTGIPDFFQPKLNHNSARAKVITASITRFIVKDMRPYSVVENGFFWDMIKTLEPRYNIPSRQHFTDKCVPELYNKVKNEVKEQLTNAE